MELQSQYLRRTFVFPQSIEIVQTLLAVGIEQENGRYSRSARGSTGIPP